MMTAGVSTLAFLFTKKISNMRIRIRSPGAAADIIKKLNIHTNNQKQKNG